MYLLLRGFPDFSAIETIMKNNSAQEMHFYMKKETLQWNT